MTNPLDVSRLHAQAVTSMLNAAFTAQQAAGTHRVYVAEVSDADSDLAYPYLVVWPSPADRPTVTINGHVGSATSTIQITATGNTPDEVLSALDRAGTALHRKVPALSGRRWSPITQQPGGTPPQPVRDDTVTTAEGLRPFFGFIVVAVHSHAPAA